MTTSQAAPIVFAVSGQEERLEGSSQLGARTDPTLGSRLGRVKQFVRVSARSRGGEKRIEAVPGQDVVALQMADGPELVLHPETVRELLLAQNGLADRGAESPNGVLRLGAQLRWRGRPASGPSATC
jgi:hypothetical protein